MFIICLLAVMGCSLTSQAATSFFPLDRVEAGQKGHARTVVQGTLVETFDIEVLGVLPDASASGDLVLIRASGDLIDRTGGIASGMSGSPVYIDGQLLGAIGYGFAMADHTIGLVTPIADMYSVLKRIPDEEWALADEVSEPNVVSLGNIKIGDTLVQGIAVAPDQATAGRWSNDLDANILVATPVRTPLMVSGLGERSLKRLGEALGGFDVVPVQAGGAPRGITKSTLEPGGAIGIQLARGDVNMSGIGTVTHLDGNGFLAFGHSFFNMGAVDLVATTAYIHHTVNSLEFPFKLGSPLAPVGRLLQDRSAAIAGTTASFADTIPVQINVFERDANRRDTFNVEIARNEVLTTGVAGVVSLEALDRSMDRLGRGTARVIMQIAGDGLPKRIVRDNMYYSHSDIAATSLTEFLIGLEAVVSNEFADVRLTSIRLDVEIEEERWTARIVQATPQQPVVRPGESVDVEVTLRPYRGPDETKIIRLDVPYDVHPGEVTVTARSGGFGYFRVPSDYVPTGVDEPSSQDEEEGDLGVEPPSIHSLEGLVDIFMNREKNNEVVVEFFPYYYPTDNFFGAGIDSDGPEGNGGAYFRGSAFLQPVQSGLSTRYVIQGSDTFTLRIAPAESEAEEIEADVEVSESERDELDESFAEPMMQQGVGEGDDPNGALPDEREDEGPVDETAQGQPLGATI